MKLIFCLVYIIMYITIGITMVHFNITNVDIYACVFSMLGGLFGLLMGKE
jgi:hypothetical protein